MRAIIIAILLTLAATGLHAQAINQAEPIAHGSPAVLYIDANRNLVNSQLDFRIVPHLGSTSIYVQKKNWKAGGDSAQVWVSDSLKGIARVYLTSAETRNTLLSNRYYAEMWQTDSTGVQRRIASGQILMSYSTIDAEPVTAADTTGTTNRPEITHIEADIANHADSLRRLDSLARLALANAATAIHKADSARNAVIAAIEADIADLTGRLDTAGTYDRVYLYGQIGQLYDSLGNLLALINTKLDADTAAITHLLDAVYARSGGASHWTLGTGYIYRDSPVTIGGNTSPIAQRVGLYVLRNIKQHPDSTARLGTTWTPLLVRDSAGVVLDSISWDVQEHRISRFDKVNGIKYGTVELDLYNGNPAPYPPLYTDYAIRADSANGVEIQAVIIETYGMRSATTNAVMQNVHTRFATSSLNTANNALGGSNNAKVYTAAVWTSSYYYWSIRASCNVAAAGTLVPYSATVKIRYSIPAANSSANPVFITEQ